jgi:hypothetical protein
MRPIFGAKDKEKEEAEQEKRADDYDNASRHKKRLLRSIRAL